MEELPEIVTITPGGDTDDIPVAVPVVEVNVEETVQLTGTLKTLDSLLQDMDEEAATSGLEAEAQTFTSTLPQAESWWMDFINKVMDTAVMRSASSLQSADVSEAIHPPTLSQEFLSQLSAQTAQAESKSVQCQAKLAEAEKDCCLRSTQLAQSGMNTQNTVLQALMGMIKAEQGTHLAGLNVASSAFKSKVQADVAAVQAMLSCLKFQMGEYATLRKAILSELDEELQKLDRERGYGVAPMDLKQKFVSAHQAILKLCKPISRCLTCPKDVEGLEAQLRLVGFDNSDFFSDAVSQCSTVAHALMSKLDQGHSDDIPGGKTIPKSVVQEAKRMLQSFQEQEAKKKDLTSRLQGLDDKLISAWANGKPSDTELQNLQEEQKKLQDDVSDCDQKLSKLKHDCSEAISALNSSMAQLKREKSRKAASKLSEVMSALKEVQSQSRALSEEQAVKDLQVHKKRVAIRDEADKLLEEEGQRRSNAIFQLGLMTLDEISRHAQQEGLAQASEQAAVQRRLKSAEVGRADFLSRLSTYDPAGYYCIQHLGQVLTEYLQCIKDHTKLQDLAFAVEQAKGLHQKLTEASSK